MSTDNSTAKTFHYTDEPVLDEEWKNNKALARVLTINPNGIDDENDPEFVPYNQREWDLGSEDMIVFLRDKELEDYKLVHEFVKDAINEMNPDGKFTAVEVTCKNFCVQNYHVSTVVDIDKFAKRAVGFISPDTFGFSQDWIFDNGVLTATQYYRDSPTGEHWEFKPLERADKDEE